MLRRSRFQSCDCGLCRSGPRRYLSLRESGRGSGLENLVEEGKLVIERVIGAFHAGSGEGACPKFFQRVTYGLSASFGFAQCAVPSAGVFSDFFAKPPAEKGDGPRPHRILV